MEDDHVDRPGVEVRQRMKLTGTNSSIGLIVLIACAHRTKFDDAFVLTRQRRCGRRAGRPAARLCRAAGATRKVQRRVHPASIVYSSGKDIQANACSFSICCALLTWWLWRGGCTRSHSEHGRETPLRPWYFVSRRGRVGRCQVCKTQLIFSSHIRPCRKHRAAQAAFCF